MKTCQKMFECKKGVQVISSMNYSNKTKKSVPKNHPVTVKYGQAKQLKFLVL